MGLLGSLRPLLRRARGVADAASEVVPSYPPIEDTAADLRRLRRLLLALPPGASFVRCRATWLAYDSKLALVCEQLEVATTLTDLPFGRPREIERDRVEYFLGECGLLLG